MLAVTLPATSLGLRDAGNTGFAWDRWTGRVLSVAAGGPAARAGMRAGDAIVSASLSPAERIRLIAPPPDATFSFDVRRGGALRHVRLVAHRAPSPYGTLDAWLIVAEMLTFAAFMLIGSLLFVLRPGWMTFALYWYCVGAVPLDALVPFYTFLPDAVLVPSFVVARTLCSGFSALPLLPFVLLFPLDSATGWRARALGPVVAAVLFALLYYNVLACVLATTFFPSYRLFDDIPALAAYAAALAVLISGYSDLRGQQRERLTIAVAGMGFAFVAYMCDYVPGLPVVVYRVANTLSLAMPLAMAYAVFKQRVLDVRFFVNRAVLGSE